MEARLLTIISKLGAILTILESKNAILTIILHLEDSFQLIDDILYIKNKTKTKTDIGKEIKTWKPVS